MCIFPSWLCGAGCQGDGTIRSRHQPDLFTVKIDTFQHRNDYTSYIGIYKQTVNNSMKNANKSRNLKGQKCIKCNLLIQFQQLVVLGKSVQSTLFQIPWGWSKPDEPIGRRRRSSSSSGPILFLLLAI